MPVKMPLLSSIKDPDTRAAILAGHVGEQVALTIKFGDERTFTGRLVSVVSVYGRDAWIAVLAYTDQVGRECVRAFPHSIWRRVERAGGE
jgi:hypothetical protein